MTRFTLNASMATTRSLVSVAAAIMLAICSLAESTTVPYGPVTLDLRWVTGGIIGMEATGGAAPENSGVVMLTVMRTGASAVAAAVSYATADGTAHAGIDYIEVWGRLNWPQGDASRKIIAIPISDRPGTQGDRQFTVRLFDLTGASPGDGLLTTVTLNDSLHAPQAPTGLVASDGVSSDCIRLTWTGVVDAAGYSVWRGASGDSNQAERLAAVSGVQYEDASFPAGQIAYYWVQATNAAGVSAFSGSDTGWKAMGAPFGLSASDGTFLDGVHLSWNPVESAGQYRVFRNTAGEFNTATWLATTAVPSYRDAAAVRQIEYVYWIQAVNDLEEGSISASDTGWRRGLPAGYQRRCGSDFAVFDSVGGCWYILSVGGECVAWAVPWGWQGATPVPGDYNGDGISDLAVFDSNSGVWYIRTLSGDLVAWAEPWGWPGAWPVSGDFDNNGAADLGVFDMNTGNWYIYSPSTGTVIAWAVAWGWPGARPVSGAAW